MHHVVNITGSCIVFALHRRDWSQTFGLRVQQVGGILEIVDIKEDSLAWLTNADAAVSGKPIMCPGDQILSVNGCTEMADMSLEMVSAPSLHLVIFPGVLKEVGGVVCCIQDMPRLRLLGQCSSMIMKCLLDLSRP